MTNGPTVYGCIYVYKKYIQVCARRWRAIYGFVEGGSTAKTRCFRSRKCASSPRVPDARPSRARQSHYNNNSPVDRFARRFALQRTMSSGALFRDRPENRLFCCGPFERKPSTVFLRVREPRIIFLIFGRFYFVPVSLYDLRSEQSNNY